MTKILHNGHNQLKSGERTDGADIPVPDLGDLFEIDADSWALREDCTGLEIKRGEVIMFLGATKNNPARFRALYNSSIISLHRAKFVNKLNIKH